MNNGERLLLYMLRTEQKRRFYRNVTIAIALVSLIAIAIGVWMI